MAYPYVFAPFELGNEGIKTYSEGVSAIQPLREVGGSILFAHADLSGFSVFEAAAWWG